MYLNVKQIPNLNHLHILRRRAFVERFGLRSGAFPVTPCEVYLFLYHSVIENRVLHKVC